MNRFQCKRCVVVYCVESNRWTPIPVIEGKHKSLDLNHSNAKLLENLYIQQALCKDAFKNLL